jgi:hypothetical protein
VQRVLEIGGTDDHGVHFFGVIQLIIIAECLHVVPHFVFELHLGSLAAKAPDIGHRHNVKVHLLMMAGEAGQ